ncbi:MAG: hypothetical protein JNN11_03875 [Candidatus Doudnabacteria bacterium]|nr:hypothetical protein [Candidatus Doudnabacteria bacterium]
MNLSRFFLITFFQWLFLLLLRFFYFDGYLGQGNFAFYLYFLLIAFVTLVLVRRFGVISYFEAIFVCIFWLGFDLFLDLIVTSAILGTGIFLRWELWIGYFVMLAVVFLLHKKRHIHIRKEQHAHHHGHH